MNWPRLRNSLDWGPGSSIRRLLELAFVCDPVLNHTVDLRSVLTEVVIGAFDGRCAQGRRIGLHQSIDQRLEIEPLRKNHMLLRSDEVELLRAELLNIIRQIPCFGMVYRVISQRLCAFGANWRLRTPQYLFDKRDSALIKFRSLRISCPRRPRL